MSTDARPVTRWRPLGRLVLAVAVVAYRGVSSLFLGPCAGFVGGALPVMPVGALPGLAALFSLAMATGASARGDCRRALVEIGMACLPLALFPVSMAANAMMTRRRGARADTPSGRSWPW